MRRNRFLIFSIIAVLIIFSLTLVGPVRGSVERLFGPVLAVFYSKSVAVRKTVQVVRSLDTLPRENEDLNNRIADLLAENARLKEIEHENILLRDELKISSENKNRRIVATRVIARSPISFLDTITIDRGATEHIATGQPVTLHGSLVGKVISAADHTAQVQLITSVDAITQAQLQNSRTNGIVKGGVRGLIMDFIPQDTSVSPGESIITSGLGGSLHPGILIGTVESVISKKNDIFQSISIKPAAPITLIDIVFVEVQ